MDTIYDEVSRQPQVWLPGSTTPRKRRASVAHARSHIRDLRTGQIVWDEGRFVHNLLHDEGEQFLLARTFDTDNAVLTGWDAANLYLGLDKRATLAENDTLATVGPTEPLAATGYSRATLKVSGTSGNYFNIEQPGVYHQAVAYSGGAKTSIKFQPGAGQNFGNLMNRFICTGSATPGTTSGKLLLSLPFDQQPRPVTENDELGIEIVIGLVEV